VYFVLNQRAGHRLRRNHPLHKSCRLRCIRRPAIALNLAFGNRSRLCLGHGLQCFRDGCGIGARHVKVCEMPITSLRHESSKSHMRPQNTSPEWARGSPATGTSNST
jgi:hypothetical protein